jgi:signal transduction histidine kinase
MSSGRLVGGSVKRYHRGDREGHRRKKSVLVVDDDSAILALCDRVLKGYRVLQARNCAEALKLVESEAVDLVLTDAKIPGECGIDLLRRIKGGDPDFPVIVMSGFSEQETVLRSLREGADDFICKKFIQLLLRESIEKALCRRNQRTELADRKRLECLRSGFLSLISHKLRTPITSISLILQYLDQSVCGPGANGFRQAIATANDEVSYLGRLVDELLLFSQGMGGDELQREEVDLASLVTKVLQESPESQAKPGVETLFEPGPLPPLNLDLRKISFALQQVIDNAYKFSEEPGQVSVGLCQGNGEVRIVVADSGSGIPPDELEKVFDKFYQVDPDGTGQVRGLGLGLFYAREYVLLHGGAITLESEPGRGTTVTIALPLQ